MNGEQSKENIENINNFTKLAPLPKGGVQNLRNAEKKWSKKIKEMLHTERKIPTPKSRTAKIPRPQ